MSRQVKPVVCVDKKKIALTNKKDTFSQDKKRIEPDFAGSMTAPAESFHQRGNSQTEQDSTGAIRGRSSVGKNLQHQAG
jgi:hypothetical protein